MNNLNLIKRTIIGGRLSSGGLDYHKFFYYDINDIYTKTNSSLSKNMPLNKLIAYLCLDELRTTYKDDQSFFNHLKNHDMPFEPKELMVAEAKRPLDISNSSFMDTIKRWTINSMYSVGTIHKEGKFTRCIKKLKEATMKPWDLNPR